MCQKCRKHHTAAARNTFQPRDRWCRWPAMTRCEPGGLTGQPRIPRTWILHFTSIEPHEAVPEVSKGKVHITQNKHVPIEWFVTTASQSRIWLKLLSDDSNKVGICLLCRSTQLHATTSCRSQFATTCDSSYVLQSITPVLQSTTPVLYSVLQSTTPVLQSTTPVLLCTTQCYSSTTLCSSTTLYYKVLLQYYSVLQSTTKYYSSTTLYYKVLLQYHSVLQSTTPVLESTAPVLLRYYKVLLQY